MPPPFGARDPDRARAALAAIEAGLRVMRATGAFSERQLLDFRQAAWSAAIPLLPSRKPELKPQRSAPMTEKTSPAIAPYLEEFFQGLSDKEKRRLVRDAVRAEVKNILGARLSDMVSELAKNAAAKEVQRLIEDGWPKRDGGWQNDSVLGVLRAELRQAAQEHISQLDFSISFEAKKPGEAR